MQNYINSKGMKSKIFGLVYDSILAEVPEDEVEIYCSNLKSFVQKDRGVSIPSCAVGCDFEIGDDYSFGKWESYYSYEKLSNISNNFHTYTRQVCCMERRHL